MSTTVSPLNLTPRMPFSCDSTMIMEVAVVNPDVTGVEIKSTINPANRRQCSKYILRVRRFGHCFGIKREKNLAKLLLFVITTDKTTRGYLGVTKRMRHIVYRSYSHADVVCGFMAKRKIRTYRSRNDIGTFSLDD